MKALSMELSLKQVTQRGKFVWLTLRTMTDRIFYLPVKLTSHNDGSGSHSYFAVRPVDRDPAGKHLLYIHPSQLRTEAGERTLEQEIEQKHRERYPERYATD